MTPLDPDAAFVDLQRRYCSICRHTGTRPLPLIPSAHRRTTLQHRVADLFGTHDWTHGECRHQFRKLRVEDADGASGLALAVWTGRIRRGTNRRGLNWDGIHKQWFRVTFRKLALRAIRRPAGAAWRPEVQLQPEQVPPSQTVSEGGYLTMENKFWRVFDDHFDPAEQELIAGCRERLPNPEIQRRLAEAGLYGGQLSGEAFRKHKERVLARLKSLLISDDG